jgi:NADH:ubiquinone oxidoreductase subunit D
LGSIKSDASKIMAFSRLNMKNSMEDLIHHFKGFTGYPFQSFLCREIYARIEAPKGEFGVYLTVNSYDKITRCKIRAPGFFHLQSIDTMAYKHLIADVVTIIGTQDIVFGEVDR